MKEVILHTHSADETRQLAGQLAAFLYPGALLTLSGQLGAGKTTFTQGLARGLGITRNVTSPTFTILKIYQGRLPLYHIDAYRLEGLDQDLGFEEYIAGDGVCVIEWSHFIQDILPEECINIEFSINDDDSRRLQIRAYGEENERIVEQLCMH
ncbi:MAG: tRNA (adenosine(37)-N6)-threonylcarbamoyltransferase complex ATPase subunit type 1 TsaE [Erysipelotrichaceae bacterium]|nr:tRNA (adenosine(37)-N6)-threonylcarbamoyltransferase complex ATPase subunit type 1 TsaE [Erysipelotrichaceae bacterium]MBR5049190.1 tRNA (adenosine(37)-N6)-threonylcarbamoyltransferase complex ATPase subunit type 1 TsaE [Erysipelotrichaceae bacterium]